MSPSAPRRAAALLVGIGAYRHADRIAPLRYAPRDARALARLAADPEVCGLAPDDICLLRDERAGRREIVRRLSHWLPERSAGADLALVYFAGHGVVERVGGREEGFLVPHDADPDDVCGQGISMGDLARWLERVQARAVVLCLDCCHAGSILPPEGVSLRGDRDLSLNPSVLAQLGGKGRFLIASCDRGQKSIESDDLRHGLFTYYLLRGLEGEADRDGDGTVSAAELFRYVSEAVQRDARERFGREQTPWTSATYSEDVPLSTVRRTVVQGDTAEEASLVEQLRLLRRKPDPERVAMLFSSLAHKSEGVRQRARQALHALGWDRAAEVALTLEDAAPVLDGLAALEASERVAALLARLVEKRHGPTRDRAARLHDRKRLSLDLERLAGAFREEKRPYELVRVLGPGLYTGAYLARMGRGGHEVVVRVLRPEFALQPMVRGAFLEAGRNAVPLVHQNLVLTRHAEEIAAGSLCYTVRDYVAGATLREVLESGRRFGREQVLTLLRQVAKGLTPLHRAGLSHNGVKPSNIFLADDGRVVLGDPSLPLPPIGWDMPRLAYDFRYASPDLFATGKLSPVSDFYSLGCVAHELLLGTPPLVADTPYELIARLGREPFDLGALDPPDRVWLNRLLGTPPFASLAEVLEALSSQRVPMKAISPAAPAAPAVRPMMAADLPPAEVLLPPESLAAAAGMQSVVPFTRADGGGVSHFGETAGAEAPEFSPAGHGPSSPPGYTILAPLGRGGMGVVYKAKQVSLDRVVALKMILGGGHASELSRQRFQTEARVVAQLHHPAILAIHDFGEHEGNAFLAMEFCPGGSLSERLHGEGLPPREAARLTAVLARGLQHAHERGIVHRDVKPGNVLFDAAGQPKLTDFGLARLMEDDDRAGTMSGAVLGTPAYMAPEQARGDSKAAGPAADIYSLGALFYHALAGRPPHQGANAIEIVMKAMEGKAAAPSQVRPGVDRTLEAICLRCLARDPAARWVSAAALAAVLEEYLMGDEDEGAAPLRARLAPREALAPQRKRWWWPF